MKKIKEIIKELQKTPRGKGILFFFGYFLFFLVLIILLKPNHGIDENASKEEKDSNPFSLKVLKDSNFHFNYKVILDGVEYSYIGDKFQDVRRFNYQDKTYIQENNKTSYIENDNLLEIANPIVLIELLDEDNLYKLLESSYSEAKTEYNSGKTTYWQLLSADTINSVAYQKVTDIDSIPSRVNVITDKDNEITGVSMVLDEYCKVSDICQNSLEVSTNYTNIGELSREDLLGTSK